MQTLDEFRSLMDESPLLLKGRVEQYLPMAQAHFGNLRPHDVNNQEAFLGHKELRVAKTFNISPAGTISVKLNPPPIVVRAVGKGLDVFILAGGFFEAYDYLKSRGPAKHTPAWKAGPPKGDYEFAVLPGAEAWLKANPWLKETFA